MGQAGAGTEVCVSSPLQTEARAGATHAPLGRSTSPTHNLPIGEEKKCLLPYQIHMSQGTFMCPAVIHRQHSVPCRVPVSFSTQGTTVPILPQEAGV